MNDINVREAMESQTAPIRKRVSQFVQGNDPAVHRSRANVVEDLKMDAIIHAERVYGDE